MFADDIKLYVCYSYEVAEVERVKHCVQEDLGVLYGVAPSWYLTLNIGKCAVMRFVCGFHGRVVLFGGCYYLGGRALEFVHSYKDLGVQIDSSSTFHQHVSGVVGAASGLGTNLLRSTICRSPSSMVSVFVLHIQPILDYCSSVWNVDFIGDTQLLETVQRRWTSRWMV